MSSQNPPPVQSNELKGKTGLKRVLNAWTYSCDGLRAAWQHEAAFRQVSLLALAGIVVCFMLPLAPWARGILVLCHAATLIVELLNSAIEAAVDHTSLAHHVLAKRAKDLGSAAQLICLCNLGAMWCGILWVHFRV